MATPRLGLVVEDKPTELSCTHVHVHVYMRTYMVCLSMIYKAAVYIQVADTPNM